MQTVFWKHSGSMLTVAGPLFLTKREQTGLCKTN